MHGNQARGAALDHWQRQAVLAAATLLRERFGSSPADLRARSVHDALLEVVEPVRRAERMQRETVTAAPSNVVAMRPHLCAGGRRRVDRREFDEGLPAGFERRGRDRRQPDERRYRR